jgi:hypothetical protein
MLKRSFLLALAAAGTLAAISLRAAEAPGAAGNVTTK